MGLQWDLQQLPPPIAALVNPNLPLAGKMPSLGNKWGPRVSLAFGVAEHHRPVLRIGYGIYYSQMQNGPLMATLTHTG